MGDFPARYSIWRVMPLRARLVVAILGVVGIVCLILDLAVNNTWLAAVAVAALFGAMAISYSFRARTKNCPTSDPGTPIP